MVCSIDVAVAELLVDMVFMVEKSSLEEIMIINGRHFVIFVDFVVRISQRSFPFPPRSKMT